MCPAEFICATKTTVALLLAASIFALSVAFYNALKAWEVHNDKKRSGK